MRLSRYLICSASLLTSLRSGGDRVGPWKEAERLVSFLRDVKEVYREERRGGYKRKRKIRCGYG